MLRGWCRVESQLCTVAEVAATDVLLGEFRSDGLDDLAELLRAIQPGRLMVSGIDLPFRGLTDDELDRDPVTVEEGAVADLLRAGAQPDLIWLTGHVSWHHVRRDLGVVAGRVDAGNLAWPVVVVCGAPLDPMPDRATPRVRASHLARAAVVRDGPYLAAQSVVGDRGDVQLCWWGAGRGLLLVLPTVVAQEQAVVLQVIADQAAVAVEAERRAADEAADAPRSWTCCSSTGRRAPGCWRPSACRSETGS